MEQMKLIGEIIGIIAVIEGFLIYLSNKRGKILILKFISDALWVANMSLVGGYTGAVLNSLCMCREFVFYNRDKHKWASSPLWLVVFMILTASSPIVSMAMGKEGLFAILPAVGSMAAVVGYYHKKPSIMRYISIFANGCWLVYNIIITNYSGVVNGIILISSALVGMIIVFIKKAKEKKKN